MASIVLKPSRVVADRYVLSIRTHDLGGTDYEAILQLTMAEAKAIAGPHTGIYFLIDVPEPDQPVAPLPITIERVPAREPNTRAWRVRIGDTLVTREKDGETIPARLSDQHVRILDETATIGFQPGQPDWLLREVEDLDDKVNRLQCELDAARAKADEAREVWYLHRDAEL